jgi:copper chaperone CopZ
MQTLSFDVSGMSCGGCTGSVQRALSKLDGITHAEVTLSPGMATVVVDPTKVTPTQIESAISRLGYPARARPTAPGEQMHQ